MALLETDEQSGIADSGARAEGGSRLILFHEVVTLVPVWWPEGGQSLAGNEPK